MPAFEHLQDSIHTLPNSLHHVPYITWFSKNRHSVTDVHIHDKNQVCRSIGGSRIGGYGQMDGPKELQTIIMDFVMCPGCGVPSMGGRSIFWPPLWILTIIEGIGPPSSYTTGYCEISKMQLMAQPCEGEHWMRFLHEESYAGDSAELQTES